MGIRIEVQLEKESYAPGEEVRGVINVLEGGPARWMQVAISQAEVTADYTDVVRSLSLGTLHSGDLAVGMSIPFSAPLPPDAKPNVVGPGSIIWKIDVEIDRRGFNVKVAQPINVLLPQSSRPPPLPPTRPVTAGGVETRGKVPRFVMPLVILLLLGLLTALALWKLSTYDDRVLPENQALRGELEQRFEGTPWFPHITSVRGDSPRDGAWKSTPS